MQRLLDRRDFLAAAKARSAAMPGLVLQARDRKDGAAPRLGLTCTKKLGNAVARNRTRRRLREAARLCMAASAQAGFDYVLVGRMTTSSRGFEDLQKDIISALQRIHSATEATTRTPPERHDTAKAASP